MHRTCTGPIKFILLFFFPLILSAQSSDHWRDVTNSEFRTPLKERLNTPDEFRTLELDVEAFISQADLAYGRSAMIQGTAPVLALPLPDGTSGSFRLQEAELMHPDLAARFPELKTYVGKGIDDPTANVRISYSPYFGLSAMILSGKHSTVYIDPITTDNQHYMSFYRESLGVQEQLFECYTEEDLPDLNREESQRLPGPLGDCNLRQYRLAQSCTGEYSQYHIAQAGGTTGTTAGDKAIVQAAMNVTMNRVNGVYERDFGVTMQFIANNDLIIYLDGATDPWSGEWNTQTAVTIDAQIGVANYDIGHNFNDTGGGNAGCIDCVCLSVSQSGTHKGRGYTGRAAPIGDPFDIDYVAHEMGHQFGGYHTQSSSGCRSGDGTTEVEPGSASTIMGYAGICAANVQSNSDDYFAYVNIRDIVASVNSGNANGCAQLIVSGNAGPSSDAGLDYSIPISTPFKLQGIGSDPDDVGLTYCWEQNDPENPSTTAAPSPTRTQGPMFRSLLPVAEDYRFMPNLNDLANNVSPTWEVLPSIGRAMEFSFTVRDNNSASGCTSSDLMSVTTVAASGPFEVLVPSTTGISWTAFTNQTVTWDVAGSDLAPVSCAIVDILLSEDGGLTYPTTLATAVANDGSHSITVPNVSTSLARIMVRAADNIFFDISDNNFTIVPGAANDFVVNVASDVASICKPTDATYSITIDQIGSYTDPVTLSVSGVPAPATSAFSVNPASTPGSSVLNISNTAGVTSGSYPLTLTGTSTSGSKDVNLTLVISDAPAGPVTLTSPADLASDVAVPTSFTWSAIGGAGVSYDIDIATDAGFASIVDNATGLGSASYTSTTLAASTTYYWRVQGSNDCGSAAFSNVFSFTTANCVTFASADVPVAIPSSGTITSTVTVGTAGTILDVNLLNLVGTHTYLGDLTVTLTSPNSTVVTLFSGECGTDEDFDLNFDDGAASATLPCPAIGGGTYQPAGSLAAFNGEVSNGVWTLTIVDGAAGDSGNLTSWGVELCLGAPPTCLPPSGLAAASITETGASLSWTENGAPAATMWDIEIGAVPFSPDGTPDFEDVTNPFMWNSGSAATTYEYYVRADCGGGDESSWVGPFSFTTTNAPIPPINGVSCGAGDISNYVFTEEFDAIGGWTGDVGSPGPSDIWEIPGNAGSSDTGPDSGFSGGATSYTNFEASGPSSATADLISPAIDLSASTGEVELSFYFHAYGAAMGTLNVGVGTNAAGPFTNVFSWIGQLQTASSDPWQAVGVDLDAYAGQTIFLRFQNVATGADWTGDMSLDYVRVEQCEVAPSCLAPTNGIASNITASAAQLDWTESGSALTWDVEYGLSGFTQGSGTFINGTSNNPEMLSGLTSASDYEFYVRAVCGGANGSSSWSGPYSFSTLTDYCGADAFLDSGGAGGNYSNNENVTTYVICPDTPGDVVSVTFDMVDIEVSASGSGSQDGCWDYLTLYNGDDVSDPLMEATLCGEESGDGGIPSVGASLLSVNDVFTSTDATGCLTFTFYSDGSQVEQGWSATVTCNSISCPTPSALSASALTINSAELGWSENGSALSWIVDYGSVGFTPTATALTSNNPEPISGLTADTDYEFYVRAYCGVGDTSAWAGPFSFSTLVEDSIPCVGGFAGIYPCSNYDLMGQLSIAELGGSGGVEGSDIWGWTDPLDDKEYAIICLTNATAFVDVSDPLNPRYLGSLATQTSANFWRDVKVYNNHAFIVADNVGSHGMQIFDLTLLRGVTSPQVFTNTAWYNGVGSAHNIAINEATGFAYIVGDNSSYSGGLHMVNIQNPIVPVLAGGFAADGYTHDVQVVVYNGPDVTYQGLEIAFASNEDTFTIIDVDDKTDPTQLSRTGYAGVNYTHQGWLTEDHRYYLMNDELDEQNVGHNTRTYMWDVQDLDAPIFMGYYEATTGSIDHNNYVKGDTLYQANYQAGLRVLDISDVANGNLNEVGFFDVYPGGDAAAFNGAWSNYPYFASGNIIISSIEDGLFIVKANPPNCSIDNITDGGNQSACSGVDNSYSNDVVVSYTNPPASGTLDVNGQSFAITSSPQTVTLVGLNSDGAAVDVTVTFSADPACTLTSNSLFTAPPLCVGPSNNACPGAMLLTPSLFGNGLWDTVSTIGASQSMPGCVGNADDDTWFYFTALSRNDNIVAQSVGASFDIVIEVFDACGGNSLGCYNNYGSGAIERVLPGGLVVGQDYYFRVYDAASGVPASTDFRVMVKTFANEGIRDVYCDYLDYPLDWVITPKRQDLNEVYPNTSVYVSGYGLRLIDPLVPDTSIRYQTGIPSWYFNLNTFANARLNTSYNATARHRVKLDVNGAKTFYWSEWGPECTIGIGGVPETQLKTQYCNNPIDYGFENQIQAEYVSGADAYRFIFDNGTNLYTEQNPSYGVFLYEVDGLEFGQTYSVTVQARVNGLWSAPGPACNIFMKTQPDATNLRVNYCNGTYVENSAQHLLAENIYGASQFEWRFIPVGGGPVLHDVTSGLSFYFHISDLEFQAGISYDVTVRAYAGGQWGDFGASCPISIQGAIQNDDELEAVKTMKEEKLDLSILPNPSDGIQLGILWDSPKGETGLVDITIVDITGKMVYNASLSPIEFKGAFELRFEEALSSGVYFLSLETGKEIRTEKFVVR